MPPPTRDDLIPLGGPGPQRAVLGGGVLLVASFWAAALLGVPSLAIAILATLCFAGTIVVLTRELAGRRRRHWMARDVVGALKRSESRFKLLADHSADMIVEADRDMVRRFVSPSSMTLLGYTPDEMLGMVAFDMVHPDDVAAYRQALATLLDGRCERVVTTQRYRRKDGTYVWTEGNIGATREPVTGAPSGYVGSLRDISVRHAALAAVRASEAFLRGVIDASPDCIEVLDRDGQVSFVSRNGLCLLGFDGPDDPVGRDFASLWPPDVRGPVHSAVAGAGAGAASRFRAHRLSARGRPLHLDVVITPIPGADGAPERLLVLSRDVTASAESEAALQRLQHRYRLLAEHSSDVVMLRAPGAGGHALYVSPSATRVFGHPPEAVAKGYPSDLVYPEDRPGVCSVLEGLAPEDDVVLHTHRVRRADGTLVWVEGAFQMAQRAGEASVVVALRDVTERQQRAQDLAAAKEVAEQARASAEQASEAKSDFLAAMSHEIRTPLNSIIGFNDLMIDSGTLAEPVVRHAELIRASGAALMTVINDILDFSKIEAGAIELESIPFSPTALARHCADILSGYAGTKALDIAVEIGERLPDCLLGDEGRLRQVLLNLLNNAVKFTPRGLVTLRVSRLTAPADAAAETVRFEVADTGIGIPEAKRHRLFERFSQVDSSVARRFGGSGLGLAISRGLVERMGGTIGVASREGEGSTFWFTVTLPVATLAVAPPPSGPAEAQRRAGRLLLVEDIDVNQRLALALLEGLGHAVDVVGDGAQAVAAVAAEAYDLVLMDVQMPGMDGVTATRLIRASEGPHRDVPILAMTANVFPEQVRIFLQAGMDGHLGKPLNRAQLHSAVDRWTGSLRPMELAAAAPAGRAEEPVPSFDAKAYGQLESHLGATRLDDVLARFAASLPQRFSPGAPTPEHLRRWKADAHVVLSVAGMVGFAELARRCRALEAAQPGSDTHVGTLEAVREAREAALERIAALRAELAERGQTLRAEADPVA